VAILVVSKNSYGLPVSDKKQPGIVLVDKLKNSDVFNLIDVPGYFYLTGFRGRLTILILYLKAIIKVACTKEEIFFYNLPPAYLPLYIMSFFTRLHRPSLFLADGINCLLLSFSERMFFRFFRRVLYLPINEVIVDLSRNNHCFKWFPGFADRKNVNFDFKRARESFLRARLLYNSSLLKHNSPELILDLARDNYFIDIIVTESKDDFYSYLLKNGFEVPVNFPVNINFVGRLTSEEYLNEMISADAVLLLRNERIFWNKYNFPSKFIEALQLNIPLFSLFDISGVSNNLYFSCHSNKINLLEFNNFWSLWYCGSFDKEKMDFIGLCDSSRLRSWI
jgi:hypothetical protein